jgi:hypothetical protein
MGTAGGMIGANAVIGYTLYADCVTLLTLLTQPSLITVTTRVTLLTLLTLLTFQSMVDGRMV